LKLFIKENIISLLLYILLLCVAGSVLLKFDKVEIHRYMNGFVGYKPIDYFFAITTHLGDGILAILVALIVSMKNLKLALYILITYLSAGILSYILKHWVYYEIYRPHFVFQYFVREELNLIEGVDIMGLHSFPSGHSLSAFALFFCLLFTTKNQLLKILYFLLAVIAAYSRVHLSQHWLIDTFVGSIIGVTFAIALYFLFYINNTKFNKGLIEIIRTKK
jgi:membrane-associated phospholipid phosphatase